MHEFSVASMIVERVKGEASKHGARKVRRVEIKLGELTLVNPEQLKFNYMVLSQDPLLRDSELIIEVIPGEVSCRECGFRGRPTYRDDPALHLAPIFSCPVCESPVEVIKGREIVISRVTLEF